MMTNDLRTNEPIQLGPMVRYAGEREATLWAQTRDAGELTVRIGEKSWSARTFAAHGHHYALVLLDGLEPGQVYEYTVEVNGEHAWPQPDSPFPAPVVKMLKADRPTKMAFGSCRTSVPHDAKHNRTNGIDSLRAYAHEMARHPRDERWPDLVVLLGDQVYADITSEAMQEFIEEKRGLDSEPGEELKDYVEYAHLYRLAYSEPAVRWMLSTMPSAMIFDDHDVRDDWNTSLAWHEEMNKTSWWHGRIVGALSSYWVYQHCGNLSPEALAEDEVWQKITAHTGSDELDITDMIEAFAEKVDRDAQSYRFSYTRDLGESKLIVLDSRAARDLRPGHRAMLDAEELDWLDGELRGDVEHLFIGTSLPFFMPEGIHMLEALDEAACDGAWGKTMASLGEKMRQTIDLEHWAAFSDTFFKVSDMVLEVARGERGVAPRTVTFLSGDIHNSFLSEVQDADGTKSRIFQAVCSPIRNPLPRHVRAGQSIIGRGLAWPLREVVERTKAVRTPHFTWRTTHGPWFDNNLATVEVTEKGLDFRWEAGEIVDGDLEHPRLRVVSDIRVDSDGDGDNVERKGDRGRLHAWQPLAMRIVERVKNLRR